MFEIFEHTADLGIRVEADSLSALLVEAAHGLTSVLVDNPEAIEQMQRVELVIQGNEPEDLLIDWLSELLYRFSTDKMLFSRFAVSLEESRLVARLWGEPIDAARHRIDTEVKAITYHGLSVEQHVDRWTAQVIVDL